MRLSSFIIVLIVGMLFFHVQEASAATVSTTLLPGSPTMSAPTSISYVVPIQSDPANRVWKSSFTVTVNGAGTKDGWHLQASSGPLIDEDGDTILTTPQILRRVSIAPHPGIASPINLITAYGFTLPIMQSVSIFTAAPNTGRGPSTVTFGTRVMIPSEADFETYTAALIVTLTSGP